MFAFRVSWSITCLTFSPGHVSTFKRPKKKQKKKTTRSTLCEKVFFCCCYCVSFAKILFWVQGVRIQFSDANKSWHRSNTFNPFLLQSSQYFSLVIGWSNTDPFRVRFHFCFWFSFNWFSSYSNEMKRTIFLWTVSTSPTLNKVSLTSFLQRHCIIKWLS